LELGKTTCIKKIIIKNNVFLNNIKLHHSLLNACLPARQVGYWKFFKTLKYIISNPPAGRQVSNIECRRLKEEI